PLLNPVRIRSLKPTQMTLGMREVAEKRREWRERGGQKGAEYLGKHMIPVVLGPKARHYVIDHHHMARALEEEGVKDVLVSVVADLSTLAREEFWVFMDNRAWCHPYDAQGRRRDFDDIPTTVAEMEDDPYRSLAGELRQAGGYAKDATPFSEFIWADFLRRRIKRKAVEKDFESALKTALTLAKDEAANYLPGWCGPDRD
ncbi:MAG TPA: ParB-like protein, partial [Caulobacteraceae bacterium]|nr:ParB-like protein [Caulobacteraceae bacterium]